MKKMKSKLMMITVTTLSIGSTSFAGRYVPDILPTAPAHLDGQVLKEAADSQNERSERLQSKSGANEYIVRDFMHLEDLSMDAYKKNEALRRKEIGKTTVKILDKEQELKYFGSVQDETKLLSVKWDTAHRGIEMTSSLKTKYFGAFQIPEVIEPKKLDMAQKACLEQTSEKVSEFLKQKRAALLMANISNFAEYMIPRKVFEISGAADNYEKRSQEIVPVSEVAINVYDIRKLKNRESSFKPASGFVASDFDKVLQPDASYIQPEGSEYQPPRAFAFKVIAQLTTNWAGITVCKLPDLDETLPKKEYTMLMGALRSSADCYAAYTKEFKENESCVSAKFRDRNICALKKVFVENSTPACAKLVTSMEIDAEKAISQQEQINQKHSKKPNTGLAQN